MIPQLTTVEESVRCRVPPTGISVMQLEFVNVSGAEPWKNKEAKKFVRSHAMKDFRRRQRERAAKHLMGKCYHANGLEAEMARSIPALDGCKSGLSTKTRGRASDKSVLVCDLRSSPDPHEPRFQIRHMLNVILHLVRPLPCRRTVQLLGLGRH